MTEDEFRKKIQDDGFCDPTIYEVEQGPIAPLHSHEKSILWLVLEGRYTMVTEEGETDYKAGDWGLNPAGTLHTEKYGTEGAKFLVGTKTPQ